MISSAEIDWLAEKKRLPTGKSSNVRFTRKQCCIAGEDARCKLRLTRHYDRPGIDGGGHRAGPEKLERRVAFRAAQRWRETASYSHSVTTNASGTPTR